MAAASSGEKEGAERERMAVKNAISGEVGGQLGLETGGPPREGTKEHMNVVEVSERLVIRPLTPIAVVLSSEILGRADLLWVDCQ